MAKTYFINNGINERRISTKLPIPDGWSKGRLPSSTAGAIARARTNHPMKGKHHSNESKSKISAKVSGENNPFYGKHHTSETKSHLSEIATGREGYWKGKHLYELTKKRLSKSRSKYTGENHPRYGKHWDEDHIELLRQKQISYLRNRDEPFSSNTEIHIRNYFMNFFEVIPQFHFDKSSHRFDMLIKLPNDVNLLLEYDGTRYHKYDGIDFREIEAKEHGYEYLVIKESDYKHKGKGLKYVKECVAKYYPKLLELHRINKE